MELLIGAGRRHVKQLFLKDKKEWQDLITLDINADHKPDVVHDLRKHPLPFNNDMFDEIHAYDVLEHLAYQGDHEFFFSEFNEYWRLLKHGGLFFAKVPSRKSVWVYGDPSHKRIIVPENLIFLVQEEYEKQVGKTAMSDFRYIYLGNFKPIFVKEENEYFSFILEAIK